MAISYADTCQRLVRILLCSVLNGRDMPQHVTSTCARCNTPIGMTTSKLTLEQSLVLLEWARNEYQTGVATLITAVRKRRLVGNGKVYIPRDHTLHSS